MAKATKRAKVMDREGNGNGGKSDGNGEEYGDGEEDGDGIIFLSSDFLFLLYV